MIAFYKSLPQEFFDNNWSRCLIGWPQSVGISVNMKRPTTGNNWVHLILANMSVGAKHDRSKYEIITNNLYAVMLRPLQK
jgi:hypothetical protein